MVGQAVLYLLQAGERRDVAVSCNPLLQGRGVQGRCPQINSTIFGRRPETIAAGGESDVVDNTIMRLYLPQQIAAGHIPYDYRTILCS